MSYITQSLACTVPNGMGPLTDAEASLLAAPPGLSTSYLPPPAPGSPGYVASPGSTDVTELQNGTAGAPSAQCGPDAQPPNQPYYTNNYPDSTAKLVNSINPFEYLYGGGGSTCGARRIAAPNWRSRKNCLPAPDRRSPENIQAASAKDWPWWLLGIAGIALLVGRPNGK